MVEGQIKFIHMFAVIHPVQQLSKLAVAKPMTGHSQVKFIGIGEIEISQSN